MAVKSQFHVAPQSRVWPPTNLTPSEASSLLIPDSPSHRLLFLGAASFQDAGDIDGSTIGEPKDLETRARAAGSNMGSTATETSPLSCSSLGLCRAIRTLSVSHPRACRLGDAVGETYLCLESSGQTIEPALQDTFISRPVDSLLRWTLLKTRGRRESDKNFSRSPTASLYLPMCA